MLQLTVRDGNRTTQWGSMFDVAWERIQMHVNGWGGHFVNRENPKECVMSEPAAVEAMEWLRARIWDDHVMATFLDVQTNSTRQAFIDQKVAMVEDGSWSLKDILDSATFRVGVAPFPAGPERRVTLATTDGFGIYSQTKQPEAAWQLLKFLVSQEYGRAMARAHFLQPARSSLVPEWADFIRQEYPDKTQDLEIEAFADGQIKGYSASAEIFPNMVGVGKIAKEAWDQIYTFGKAPVSIIEDVCRQIEAVQASATSLPLSCDCAAQDRG
jgi:multiple sugar transport system substrate-binding protein